MPADCAVDSTYLIENFRPGTLERWGLGYDVLAPINPRLILVRISGYGQTGPYSGRAGYGTVAEAMSERPLVHRLTRRPADTLCVSARRLACGDVRRAGRD